MFAEDALEGEAEALGRAARRGVERVALPLEAAIAELIEGAGGEQVDRLRRGRRALQRRAEPDVTDLDRTVLGLDSEVGEHPERKLSGQGHDGEEERVLGGLGKD